MTVALRVGVDHQRSAARSAQHQGGTQARRAAANDDTPASNNATANSIMISDAANPSAATPSSSGSLRTYRVAHLYPCTKPDAIA
jgi:hypothetical protein